MAATYEPIATTTLGSAASTITFNSIASSWTDLRVVIVGTLSAADQPFFRLNNDSTTLYSQTNLYGDGATAGSNRNTTANRIYFDQTSNFSTTIPAYTSIDIFSYAGSTFKTSLLNTSIDKNGSGEVHNIVGLYRSTTAITRIDLIAGAVNWSIGTTATLYGIKAA